MRKRWLRFKSQWFLFAHTFAAWARMPFTRRASKRSWERFFSRYFPLGFLPVGLEEYSQQPKLESCIGCSYCIWTCECLTKSESSTFNLPKRLVLNEGRSPQLSETFAMEGLGCLRVTGCSVQCPQGVPIHFAAERILNWRRMRGIIPKKKKPVPGGTGPLQTAPKN